MNVDRLLGVWRRDLIAWPDGRRDTTARIHWLQTRTAFADLRLPKGEGFAGHIRLQDDVCTWHRRIDTEPAGAPPDMGRLHFEGGLLIEHGIHQPYVEHWRRIDDGSAGMLVLELADAPGLLVRAGGHVLRAIGGRSVEVSHAMTYGSQAWRIHASTLPERQGEILGFDRDGEHFRDRQGRRWRLAEASANLLSLLP